MNEREIFQSAVDIADDTERQLYLDRACGTDGTLRKQVDQLLHAHGEASQFLAVPAAAQLTPNTDDVVEATTYMPNGTTASPPSDDDAASLEFLEPSTKPGSLGRLAHYEVLEVLGRGAFGIVLKAFDEKLHRMVAIKVMNSELAATSPPRKRFLREAQSSARIRHENIVSIYAVEEQPLPYLVMEYIPGGTLQQRLDQKGPLDIEDILRLGHQIALGLAAAHAQGLIHRDIKPANILIEAGVEERVKITDFGLARATDDASLTQSGLIAGTPMYMAPEQAKGQALDHRTDLFSLGSVLYTMASGRPPFRAPNTIAVLKRVCEDTPRPIREVIPETPSWLSDIIGKLLAKEPDDRFQSAKEVADALAKSFDYLQNPATAPQPLVAATPKVKTDTTTTAALKSLRGPGLGLILTACLNVLDMIGLMLASYLVWNRPGNGFFPAGPSELFLLLIVIAGSGIILIGGLNMRSGQRYGLCLLGCIAALFVGPMYIVGWPVAIWGLIVLSRPDVRALFSHRAAVADDARRTASARPPMPAWAAAIIALCLLPVLGCLLLFVALAIPAYQAASFRIPALPSANAGRGLQFDGKDDYAKVEGLNWAYPQFTLEAFVTSATDGDNGIIAMLQDGGPQSETMFLFDGPANSQGRISGAGILGQKPFGNALAPLSTGVRQHRALVFDGEVLHYFVNGKWQGKRYNMAKEGLQWNMHELWIGCKSSETEFFRGTIDQVRISRVARYTNTFPPVTSLQADDKTLALYNFDEGAGDVLHDISGNNHHGRIFGANWVQPRSGSDDGTPLVDTEWQPLFNGRNFTGWEKNNHWSIENGALLSRVAPTLKKTPAMLVTRSKNFRDFHARIEAKINNGGDSGLFFRFGEKGDKAIQAQITAAPTGIGSLLREATTIVPTAATVRPDTWFTLEVLAQGPNITVRVDGVDVVNWLERTGEIQSGPLALEAGFPGTEFFVRKVEVKMLPPPTIPSPAIAPFDAAQAKTHQEAWAKSLGVPVEYTNDIGMKFRLIPPGEFLMGSPASAIDKLSRELEQAGANDFEKFVARFSGPQHRVRITQPFYLGQHEVTVGQYRRFITNKKYLPTMQQLGVHRFKWEDSAVAPNAEDRAVVGISWDDAEAFCHWVSDHTGLVTEIPTEAQWEYACRAGATTLWSFGDDPSQLSEYAVFGGPGFIPAEVIGSKKPNPFGLFDMHGNADEWCRDWHDKDFYAKSPVDDPVMLANPSDKNSGRVARGGTSHSAPWWTYSSTRPWDFPATPNTPKGVRVTMSVDTVREALRAAPNSPVSALKPENH